MSESVITLGPAFQAGWEKTKKNLPLVIGVGLMLLVASAILQALETAADGHGFTALVIFLLWWVYKIIADAGLIRLSLDLNDRSHAAFRDFFCATPVLLKYAGALIAYTVIVIAGFLLLIVPGVIWGIQFSLYGFLVVDKKLGPLEALQKSSALTRGVKKELAVFYMLCIVLNIAGLMLLFVGLFVSVPVTLIATAEVYRKLAARPQPKPVL